MGAIAGLMLGRPVCVLLGVIVGHLFDIGFFQRLLRQKLVKNTGQVQHVFFDSTFSVMGYLAKADGRVSESEIRAAERVMWQMDLNADMKREAIELFNRGKQPDFDLSAAIRRLKTACWRFPNMLRTFLEIQIQIASAEGQMSVGKRAALESICAELGIHGFIFRGEQSGQSFHQPRRSQSLEEAYQALNVSGSTSDAEIKKAYRRLLSQNHPDKLMAQGLPPEMIKLANERTQKIKSAYEMICNARGV